MNENNEPEVDEIPEWIRWEKGFFVVCCECAAIIIDNKIEIEFHKAFHRKYPNR